MKVWVDGVVVEADQARVSVFDHGLTVGDGVFETAKVIDGVPFALTRHLDRLASSARGLGLAPPEDGALREAVAAALAAIRSLEQVPRGPYCGAVGWVDADTRRATLAVGIRTFWAAGDRLHLGTGAGITWGSDAAREWDETELKAHRLLAVAAEESR